MYTQATFWLSIICAMLVAAAEPSEAEGQDNQRAVVLRSLEEKLAEAERLQSEIQRLRQLVGEPSPNISVRVRVVEVSLNKMKDLGWALPDVLNNDGAEIESQFERLYQKRVAKLVTDKVLTVADGSETQLHEGAELAPEKPRDAKTYKPPQVFRGTDISLSPKSQADGRLAITFTFKKVRPATQSGHKPHRRVRDISTVIHLAPGEAIVLEGDVDQRVESSVRGPFPGIAATLGQFTDTIHEIETVVILSRDNLSPIAH